MFIIVHDGIAVEIPSAIDAEGPDAVTAFYLAAVARVKAAQAAAAQAAATHPDAPEVIEGANPEE